MITRILVAVDDSTPALAAARFAIELAGTLSAELVVVTVDEAGRNSSAILDHVSGLAATAEVAATTVALSDGRPPFEILLHAIDVHGADLAVMGRSDLRSTGRPYVGSQTEHLLEFTHVPVVVVPGPMSEVADVER